MIFAKLFDVGGDDQVLIRMETVSDTTNIVLETFVDGVGYRTTYGDTRPKMAKKFIDDLKQETADQFYQEVKETIS